MNTTVTHLGDVPVCSVGFVLPLVASETGTWAFMTTFNRVYQYIQFQATEGQNIVVPAKLNENYTYTFKLFQPDNSLFSDNSYCMTTMPMLDGIDYLCPLFDGAIDTTVGKLQLEAAYEQTVISSTELVGVKQVAVFVEGAMRQEGDGADEFTSNKVAGTITFNTPLIESQKITILYFK